MRPVIDETLIVTLDQVRGAILVLAEKSRIIAEGAGALPLAAIMAGQVKEGPVVAVVSGGNIDLDVFCACVGRR